MNKHKIFIAILLSCLLIGILIIGIPKVRALTTTKPPTAYENNQWTYPTRAYISDNLRAYESTSTEFVTYTTFNFENTIPEDAPINKVYVNFEGYVSVQTDQDVLLSITTDGGSYWSSVGEFNLLTTETTNIINITSRRTWNTDLLNNTNFKIKLTYWQSGGCYPNRTYFLSWNETAKEDSTKWVLINVEDLKEGDLIFCYDDMKKELTWQKVKEIQIHKGTWILRDIYSGNLTAILPNNEKWEWIAHNIFTDNHPVEYILPNGTITRGVMKDLKEGYSLFHLFHDPPYFAVYVAPEDHYLKDFKITKIINSKFEGVVYNVIADQPYYRPVLKYFSDQEKENMTNIARKYYDMDFAQFFDPPIGKTTAYLDQLTVTVDYTGEEPQPPQENITRTHRTNLIPISLFTAFALSVSIIILIFTHRRE